MRWVLGAAALLLLSSGVASGTPGEDVDCARVPPAIWCKSDALARRCDVQAACASFRGRSKGKRVRLTLLFEALCPDCQQFISQALYRDVFLKFGDFVDLELVPFGNAKLHVSLGGGFSPFRASI